MELEELQEGDEINVGDVIKIDRRSFGVIFYDVHRVTPKFAYVKYNDVAEGKFPRKIGFWFKPIPRDVWNINEYSAFRKKAHPKGE